MKIAVITPTIGRIEYLAECIKSVQLQVLEPLDIEFVHVVVDVNTSDGTADYLKTDSELQIITLNHKANAPTARNLAISQVDADFICVLDDDDIMLKRTLFNFANLASQHKEKKWFCSDFLRINSVGKYLLNEDHYGWEFNNKEEMMQAIFSGYHFMQGNVMYSLELFKQVGGYDENLSIGEDIDLYIRFLLQEGLPVYSNFCSHLHRVHESNTTRDWNSKAHQMQMVDLQKKYNFQLSEN